MAFGNYPYSLVPYKGLKNPIDFDTILNNGEDFCIARRFSGSIDNDLKLLGEVYIFKKPDEILEKIYGEISQLSMTILGAGASLEDMKYEQKKPACDYWDGRTHLSLKYRNKVNISENCYSIVYNASNIHRKPVEYKKKFQKKTDFEKEIKLIDNTDSNINILLKNFASTTQYPMQKGQVQIIHKPTNLNYWHTELMLLPASLLEKDKVRNVNFKKDKKEQDYSFKDLMVRFTWKTILCQGFEVMKNSIGDFPLKYTIDENSSSLIRVLNSSLSKWMYRLTPGIVSTHTQDKN